MSLVLNVILGTEGCWLVGISGMLSSSLVNNEKKFLRVLLL